ncbi:hemolysin [Lactobacillus sp.] [Lactiplantibacillus mudanjiangensis]|uniref:hemolysin family protein n=1 Tax=Lactiplantibacillus mudanjiangensis TaxID=1296538 RepID=UPI001014EB6F|nr:hemolysin family protein [Lactiplantibacillus mudanjiangensis]VDG18901.1 hemolysin [Lactobacillus sp.] [Lactiplantibacillus mudanjiangensis]VDG33000.1 hemolysin [Lactobacillus sp.] [Lactiplantibacillus mudanjiangensis]
MDSGQIITNLVIIVITFCVAAFFVACEFALVQTRPSALEEEQKKRDKPSKRIATSLHMVHNLNEYLSTTQVGVSVAGIILGWIGEQTTEHFVLQLLDAFHLSISTSILRAISIVVGVFVLTYLEVVLTEIVPKNIAIDMPLKVMAVVTTPLRWFHVIFYPFVWLLNTSSAGVVKMLGIPVANEDNDVYSQAEILNLSRNAVSGGELDRDDYLYMERAFEFNDKIAKDVMIDRTQLVVIDINDTVKQAIRVYLQKRFSRLPVVANNDKDKILGYVYNYDLIRQGEVDDEIRVNKVLRNIITIPETTPIQEILQKMIQKQTPIVVVVDEYGGTSGIVTDKDIYEELFGTVNDEIDNVSTEYVEKQDNGNYRMSGKMTLYDFERFFKIDLREFEDSDVVTLTGYVLDNFPKIQAGDTVQIADFDFKALDFENAYINWFEVSRREPVATATGDDEDKAE